MADVAGLAQAVCALPALAASLPDIFFWTQVSVYLVLVLFFGHIAGLGYRGYLGRLAHLGARLALGALALLGGMATAALVPVPALLRAMLVDVAVAGTGYAALLLGAVWLLTRNVFNVPGMEKEVARLQERLKKAAEVAKEGRRERFKDPFLIAGIVGLGALVTVALAGFHGFPSLFDLVLGSFGITAADIQTAVQLVEAQGLCG